MYFAVSLEGKMVRGRLAYKYVNCGGKTLILDVIQVLTEYGFDEIFVHPESIRLCSKGEWSKLSEW